MPLFLICQRSSPLYSGSSSTQKIENWFSVLKLIFIKKCMPLSKFEHLNMGCKIYRINDFRNVIPRIL